MAIKFYLDTHLAKAIAEQLRSKGVDVVRAEDVGMATASDEEHLQYATSNGYVVISQDADFAEIHVRWVEDGRSHGGIMKIPRYLQGEAQISFLVKELSFYHEAALSDALDVSTDLINQIIYLCCEVSPMDMPMLHIEISDDGVPRTLTNRVKVKMIVQKYLFAHEEPDAIAAHYGISLADVHAALAYYYDNKQAMDADFEAKEALLHTVGVSSDILKSRILKRMTDQKG